MTPDEREAMVKAVVNCVRAAARTSSERAPHGLRSMSLGQVVGFFSATNDGAPSGFLMLNRQRQYRLIQNAVRAAVRRKLIRAARGPWKGVRYSLP